MIGRQLPVYSPVGLRAILGASGSAFGGRSGAVAALAAQLEARFDAEIVVPTSSGTHALQLALGLVPARAGQTATIAMPAYSCFDLVSAAVGARVRVRFYDIDPLTLSPDLDSLRLAIDRGADAIVAGNLYGYPIDWVGLTTLCAGRNVLLIEDAAQGQGSRVRAGVSGALGDASILSFGRGKGWTGGGGGALLVRGPLASASAAGDPPGHAGSEGGGAGARNAVVTLAAWALGRPTLYRIPASIPALGLGETHYRDPTAARGISRFSAGLAGRTLEAALGAVERRQNVALAVRAALQEISAPVARVCEPCEGWESSAFLRLPLMADSGGVALSLADRGRELGVSRGYPKALHRLEQTVAILADDPGQLPGSEALAARLVTLPTHRWVGETEVRALAKLLG